MRKFLAKRRINLGWVDLYIYAKTINEAEAFLRLHDQLNETQSTLVAEVVNKFPWD